MYLNYVQVVNTWMFVLGRLWLPASLPFRSQKSIGFFTSFESTFASCGIYASRVINFNRAKALYPVPVYALRVQAPECTTVPVTIE